MCFRIRSARHPWLQCRRGYVTSSCRVAPGYGVVIRNNLTAVLVCLAVMAGNAYANDEGAGAVENEGVNESVNESGVLIDEDTLVQMEVLRTTIEGLEQGGNTWHPEIAETILSLAGHVQATGDHDAALALLERAVHLSRVNHGLFSLQQVRGLRMQVDSHLAMNQWDEADGLQQYAFFVQNRAMGDDNPEMIPALEAFAEWSIQAFASRRGDFPAARLIDAYHLYSVALSIMDDNPEIEDSSRREVYLQKLACLAWLMSRTGIQTRAESQFSEYRRVDDAWVDRLTQGRYRYRNNAFAQGESALRQVANMHAENVTTATDEQSRRRSLRRQAESMLDVGDWHLLFERRQASTAVYQQAWSLLEEEDEAMRQAVFERVIVLPRFEPMFQLRPRRRSGNSSVTALAGNEGSDVVPAESTRTPYVVMAFDINQFGRARNVQIVESWPEDDADMQRRLSTALRESRLRPTIRGGGPVMAEGLLYRFPY